MRNRSRRLDGRNKTKRKNGRKSGIEVEVKLSTQSIISLVTRKYGVIPALTRLFEIAGEKRVLLEFRRALSNPETYSQFYGWGAFSNFFRDIAQTGDPRLGRILIEFGLKERSPAPQLQAAKALSEFGTKEMEPLVEDILRYGVANISQEVKVFSLNAIEKITGRTMTPEMAKRVGQYENEYLSLMRKKR